MTYVPAQGKGKKKRRGSLTSFFAADGGVSDGDASPGNNIKIDNPILTVKSSDDGENGSLVMKNPLDMMDSMDDPELDPFAVMKVWLPHKGTGLQPLQPSAISHRAASNYPAPVR